MAGITEVYEGGDIILNEEQGIVLSPREYESLLNHTGKRLIVTDGTTLLGADDKAGVAEILSAAELLLASNLPHGTVKIAFTPDEEIGEGADHLDVAGFGAEYAYTSTRISTQPLHSSKLPAFPSIRARPAARW